LVLLADELAGDGTEATMKFDATSLSRIQFAWVIGWHILLPAFTMGIAAYIALLEGPAGARK
jgi:cytochrome bd-type quinol oxidase subunit 1